MGLCTFFGDLTRFAGSSRAGGGQLTLSCKVVKSSLDPQRTEYIPSPLRLS
jgi:hypothetical protein